MIVYKIDKPTQQSANAQMRDMGAVLSEITPTLRILRDLLQEHKASISTQHIDQYRADLERMVAEASRLTHLIAVYSQRLSTVSDHAAKQLEAVDQHVIAALQGQHAEPAVQQATTPDTPKVEATVPERTGRTLSFSKTFSRI